MSKPVVTITPEQFAHGVQQALGKRPVGDVNANVPTTTPSHTSHPMEVAKHGWKNPRGWTRMITRRGKGLRDLSITVYQDHLELGSEAKLPLDVARHMLDVWQAGSGEFSYQVNEWLTVNAQWMCNRYFRIVVAETLLSGNLHECISNELEAKRALGKVLVAMPR